LFGVGRFLSIFQSNNDPETGGIYGGLSAVETDGDFVRIDQIPANQDQNQPNKTKTRPRPTNQTNQQVFRQPQRSAVALKPGLGPI
jgi:hypothetical protein